MRIKVVLSAILLAVCSLSAKAITDIESQRHNDDVDGLKGAIDFSITGKSGNSDKQTSAASGRLDYRRAESQALFIAKTEYGESNKIKDADNNFVHFRYIHHNSERFAWESFMQYQDDEFKLLDSRKLIGGGVRYDLSVEQTYQLSLGLGAYYTEEVHQLAATELREDYARANSYVSYSQQLTDTATISNTLYWQPRFSRLSDSYVYNNFSLSVKINDALSLKVSLESQYDSQPVANVEHSDHSYYTALVYEF